MKERLCRECASQNKCWFVDTFNKRVDTLPLSKDQTRIAPDVKITKEASAVSKQITEDRVRARSYACPQVNYNPQDRRFQPNI